MERTFHVFDQVRDAVQAQTGRKISQVSGHDLERLPRRSTALSRKTATEGGVHRVSEGSA